MLKERQKSILEAAIVEHIRTARPVASQDITEKIRPPMSPATIRSEMQTLDEEGYLMQPHTSAGRVPTDQGYRFFVDNLVVRCVLTNEEEKQFDAIFAGDAVDEFIKIFSKTIADVSGSFAAVGAFGDDFFYDNGLSEIFDEPEFEEPAVMRSFGRLVDQLDEVVPELFRRYPIGEDAIFIGSENPLKDAHEYSMTISRWHHPRGFEGFLAMVGPRRTRYQKHIAILKYLEEQE